MQQCFNGATLFQAWKPRARGVPGAWLGGASMGPRFFKRGNKKNVREFGQKLNGFNGATLFQAWKPILPFFFFIAFD